MPFYQQAPKSYLKTNVLYLTPKTSIEIIINLIHIDHCMELRYFDLDGCIELENIESLFPNWSGKQNETVVFLSPHDDDVLLGAGYCLFACLKSNINVKLIIFHSGNAGYSRLEQRNTITSIRKTESRLAYGSLGLSGEDILYLDLPDFSGLSFIGWQHPSPGERAEPMGTFPKLISYLLQVRGTRLIFSNGYREHLDHLAVAITGIYYGPQVGDPVGIEWGKPSAIKSYLMYAVWTRFNPIAALQKGKSGDLLSGDRAIVVSHDVEREIQSALSMFKSQQDVIEYILDVRKERYFSEGFIEVYQTIDPRPRFDYNQYKQAILKIIDNRGI